MSESSIGILLTNLGTPNALTTRAIRKFLREFLWDPRVVEIPRPFWWLLLHGFVLPFRPQKILPAYQKIWTKEGSPLLSITQRLTNELQTLLQEEIPQSIKVVCAMRYGTPSITEGLEFLRQNKIQRILVLPLYPQYSATTTASTFDAIAKILKSWRYLPELRTINHYADESQYLDALKHSITHHFDQHGKPQRLLFSFHGLPKFSLERGDPYYWHCHKTANLLAEKLGLEKQEWQLTFQSRFGRTEWLQPYTQQTLQKLPKQGIKHVAVICPGFSVDCLETLEEINLQNRQFFMNAGGETFHYIPALNDSQPHLKFLTGLIKKHLQGW